MGKFCAVITTIQPPTSSIIKLATILENDAAQLVVVGDKKGPQNFNLSGIAGFSNERLIFLDVDAQLESNFKLADKLPFNHYSRKNIGYLQAIAQGAPCIYETDDDNAPLPSW